MAAREITKMGNPVLRKKARELAVEEINSDAFKQLVEDMQDSMNEAGGIGIAAPQIGVSQQVAIIDVPDESDRYDDLQESERYIIVNPKITILDKTTQGFWEGCLSVPGLRGFVERPREVQIDYLDQEGKKQKIVVSDFLATVFQHELDHLFGTLYVDRIKDLSKLSYEAEFIRYHTPEVEE